jgi:hypothetical protein
MEVKDFVKTILKEVNEAVSESDNEQFRCYLRSSASDGYIDFDLAVVSKQEVSGKIGAEVLGIGGKTEGNTSNEAINRIRFKVFTYKKSN